MKLWTMLVAALTAAVLAGCGAPPVREAPPQAGEAERPPERPPGARTAPYREPEPPPEPAEPVYGPAVRSLLETAEAEHAAGKLDAAAAAVERALRIEPRNAHLWNRLARLRVAQDRLGEAADLAAKSNALAGPQPRLKADNWRLIGAARRAAGDMAGARAAEHKAREQEGRW